MKKALIVIPTYNERENIKILIPEIFKIIATIKNWNIDVLIIDDSSPDKTGEEVNKLIKIYPHLHLVIGEKEGLGKAYVRGFRYGNSHMKPDVMFEMDADGQHDPHLIPHFLKKIDEGSDFVIGSRYIKGGSIPHHWKVSRKFYSIIGNLVAKLGFMHLEIHDWTSGYRCISASFLKKIIGEMEGYNGYVFQIALLDRAIKSRLAIGEIPLNFTDRREGESKFDSVEFIIDASLYVINHSTFIKFVIVGLIGFAIDFFLAAVFIYVFNIFKPHANAISAECAIISNFLLNNFWSFKHKRISHRFISYIKKFVSFNIVSSGSILVQWFGMLILIKIFGDHMVNIIFFSMPTWIIYKIFIIFFIIIPYSYFMYNKIIWTNKQ